MLSDLHRGFVIEGWSREEGRATDALPAYLGPRWNGFERPYFDRATASKVIEEQAALLESLPPERRLGLYSLAWHADTILVSLIPRPGTAAAECSNPPTPIEPTLIYGTPHWNLGLGWRWERTDENGAPSPQRAALPNVDAALSCIRHSLRLERRAEKWLADGSEVISVVAHLGDFADPAHRPIPISVGIGTVTLTPEGAATLTLNLTTQIAAPTPPDRHGPECPARDKPAPSPPNQKGEHT